MMMELSRPESEIVTSDYDPKSIYYGNLSPNSQHDSFLSSNSSPTTAPSPTPTSIGSRSDSDEGVSMATSPNSLSEESAPKSDYRRAMADVQKHGLTAENMVQAYRRLSLTQDQDESDQPIDLSMKTQKSMNSKEHDIIKSQIQTSKSPTQFPPRNKSMHGWPFSNANITVGATPSMWHPALFMASSLQPSNQSTTLASTTAALSPLPNFLPTSSVSNTQVAGMHSLYNPNLLAEFSRMLASQQAAATRSRVSLNPTFISVSESNRRTPLTYEQIKQERLSNNPSPASSTGSYKRKANEELGKSDRLSPIGLSEESNDSISSISPSEKRMRLQAASSSESILCGLPTYINYSADLAPPTMVPGAYATKLEKKLPSTKEPTPIDFKPCRYPCTSCGRTYATIGGLVKHSKSHHDPESSKIFKCKTCDKEYTSLGALKMHIRTHTLPCKCHICGKAFSRTWLLQGHIRTHTGEKPYQCTVCMRAFADRSNLRAHMQTHEAVKRYACTTCDKTYSRISLLNRHQSNGCGGKNINKESKN